MDRIGKVLKKSFKELGIEKPLLRYQALTVWDRIVGKRIAGATEPIRVSGGKMFVKVKNDTWRNELVFHKKAIIKKLNDQCGARIIDDIVWI